MALSGLDGDNKAEIDALLLKYGRLIAKAVQTTEESEREVVLSDLQDMDREMKTLFESRRLMTSDLGTAAVTDASTRGKGGSVGSS